MCSIFFFSSRRRHTRWNCDWSSDVCSSDLVTGTHNFKIGTQTVHARQDASNTGVGTPELNYTFRKATPDALPTPVSVTQFAGPTTSKAHVRMVALYAQDQWTFRRLTLNVGLRFD